MLSVSLNVDVFGLNDANGNEPSIPSQTIAVVDRDRDGVGRNNPTTDSFLFDQDDWIVEDLPSGKGTDAQWNEATGHRGNNNWLTSNPYSFNLAENGGTPDVDQGDPVFLFWYPGLDPSAEKPGPNQPFGVFEMGKLPADPGGLSVTNLRPGSDFPGSFTAGNATPGGDDTQNEAPLASDDSSSTQPASPLQINVPGVLGNDSDPEDADLSVTAVNGSESDVGNEISLSSGALLTLRADGSYRYNPNGQFSHLTEGESETDGFSYQVSDPEDAASTAEVTITVAEPPTPLVPQIEGGGPGGVSISFSKAIEPGRLELHAGGDAGDDPPDVVVKGPDGESINGSLVWSGGDKTLHFVPVGRPLPGGDYTVEIPARSDGLVDDNGFPVDGNDDGDPGGDFAAAFQVSAAGRVVSVADVVRGPGQDAVVPATGDGLPVRIDDGDGVTAVSLELRYASSLLDVSAINGGDALPGDWQITTDLGADGRVVIDASGSTALHAGPGELFSLRSAVPSGAEAGASGLIAVEGVSLNGGAIDGRGGRSVQKVTLFGDADGDGRYSGLDASLVARNAVDLDDGFAAFPRTAPQLIADIDGDGRFSGLDASLVARQAVDLPQPDIPDPAGGSSAFEPLRAGALEGARARAALLASATDDDARDDGEEEAPPRLLPLDPDAGLFELEA